MFLANKVPNKPDDATINYINSDIIILNEINS